MLGKVTGLDVGRAEQRVARLIGAAALLTGAGLHLVFVPGYSLPVLDGLFTAQRRTWSLVRRSSSRRPSAWVGSSLAPHF